MFEACQGSCSTFLWVPGGPTPLCRHFYFFGRRSELLRFFRRSSDCLGVTTPPFPHPFYEPQIGPGSCRFGPSVADQTHTSLPFQALPFLPVLPFRTCSFSASSRSFFRTSNNYPSTLFLDPFPTRAGVTAPDPNLMLLNPTYSHGLFCLPASFPSFPLSYQRRLRNRFSSSRFSSFLG